MLITWNSRRKQSFLSHSKLLWRENTGKDTRWQKKTVVQRSWNIFQKHSNRTGISYSQGSHAPRPQAGKYYLPIRQLYRFNWFWICMQDREERLACPKRRSWHSYLYESLDFDQGKIQFEIRYLVFRRYFILDDPRVFSIRSQINKIDD